MKPIKIVRIITRLNIGGPAVNAVLLSSGLNNNGFSSCLVAGSIEQGEGDMSYFAEQKGVRPFFVPELGRGLNLFKDLTALWKIYGIIKREQPDVVHTHTAKAGTLGRIAAILAGVRVRIHTFHGHVFDGYFGSMSTKVFVAIERFLAGFTTKVVAVSNSVANDVSMRYNIAPKEKIVVMPLGFDLEKFLDADKNRGKLKKELGLPQDSVLAGIVGRLVPIKNHRMFLDVAKNIYEGVMTKVGAGLKPAPTRCLFIIVGDGELRQELEAYTERLSITQHVVFLGWRRDLEDIYADLDVVCLTSLNEGTPVSLIEAMAAARPVVATDVGGVRDIVRNGENGLLVPSNDVSGFGKTLLKMLEDREKRIEMGKNGREFVKGNFNKDRLIKDTKDLYESLLKSSFRHRNDGA